MEVIGIVLVIASAVLLIGLIWYISTSNTLNKTIVKIKESESGIDIALEKRYDVLIKMQDVVKAYSKHEEETLTEAIKLRQGMSIKEKQNVDNKITEMFGKLNLVVENYPDLKASQNYNTLQLSIVDTEEHLQAARRVYNSNISRFNQMIVTFPTSIISNSKGMILKDFYKVDELKKQDIQINL